MIIDFTLPINGDLAAGFERYKRVSKKSVMDYGFHMAVTTWNEKVRILLTPLAWHPKLPPDCVDSLEQMHTCDTSS